MNDKEAYIKLYGSLVKYVEFYKKRLTREEESSILFGEMD